LVEIEIAGADEVSDPTSGLVAQFAFSLAPRTARLWRVEADEAEVWRALVEPDRVAINHADIAGGYRVGVDKACWQKRNRN
jgi:hypothetical protein